MKKKDKTAWWLFGLGSALIWFKHRLDAITMRLQSLSVANIDPTQKIVTLRMVVDLIYPLPIGITIKTLSGDLYIMGKRVATLNNQINRYIAASSVTPIQLTVDVDMSQLADGVISNIQSGSINNLVIQLDARATTNLLPISLHKTFAKSDLV